MKAKTLKFKHCINGEINYSYYLTNIHMFTYINLRGFLIKLHKSINYPSSNIIN